MSTGKTKLKEVAKEPIETLQSETKLSTSMPAFTPDEWQFISQAINAASIQGVSARTVVVLLDKMDQVRDHLLSLGLITLN